jgi:hypothetical protein
MSEKQHFNERLERLADLDLSQVIIAVDFDGTCVTHEFPKIGGTVPGAVEVLRALNRAGAKLIIWTIRSDQSEISNDPNAELRMAIPVEESTVEYLKAACRWFDTHGIKIYGANCNHQQKEWSSSPKAYAHIYIDDAAIGCPLIHFEHERPFVNWDEVLTLLIERFIGG